MTDKEKIEKNILLIGAAALALFILFRIKKEKHSGFVDDELSEAEGKKYRPSQWNKVAGQWVWANSKGDLIITHDYE